MSHIVMIWTSFVFRQTETTTQQIGTILEHMNATQFEFPGSRSEQGYDSVATVALVNE